MAKKLAQSFTGGNRIGVAVAGGSSLGGGGSGASLMGNEGATGGGMKLPAGWGEHSTTVAAVSLIQPAVQQVPTGFRPRGSGLGNSVGSSVGGGR